MPNSSLLPHAVRRHVLVRLARGRQFTTTATTRRPNEPPFNQTPDDVDTLVERQNPRATIRKVRRWIDPSPKSESLQESFHPLSDDRLWGAETFRQRLKHLRRHLSEDERTDETMLNPLYPRMPPGAISVPEYHDKIDQGLDENNTLLFTVYGVTSLPFFSPLAEFAT
jgi:hypothetical protein